MDIQEKNKNMENLIINDDNHAYVLDNKKEALKENITATLKGDTIFYGKIPSNKEFDKIDSIIDNDNLIVVTLPIFKYNGNVYSIPDKVENCLSVSEISEKIKDNIVFIYTLMNNNFSNDLKYRVLIKEIE